MVRAIIVLLACFAPSASARDDYSPDALKDQLTNLPGAPAVPWKMFSGYIDVSKATEAKGTRQMFYWFVESQRSAESDPLMLWSNGGPGCSGLGGFLTEQGPFRPAAEGKSLVVNEHSWNKMANMVFIEQPVGVGFSLAKGQVHYGDADAAEDNYKFALGFFERYPQYKAQDFYITSESYGGHYMPTMAQALVKGGGVPNFKGVFLGNPITYMPYRNFGQYGTSYGHQLLPQPLWKRYMDATCKDIFPPSNACGEITDEMDQILSGFDPYALDFPTCNSGLSTGRHERWVMSNMIRKANLEARGAAAKFQDVPYEPCSTDFATMYLNRADVQAAIRVAPGSKWALCTGIEYNMTDVNQPMMPVWTWLLHNSKLKVMIYSGDDDAICATLGTQQFIWNFGDVQPKKDATWQPWKVDGQVAGFKTDFEVLSNKDATFHFVTVHGAGHMVPSTQPVRSLALLEMFLQKKETQNIIV